jgi:hypothetical protein
MKPRDGLVLSQTKRNWTYKSGTSISQRSSVASCCSFAADSLRRRLVPLSVMKQHNVL